MRYRRSDAAGGTYFFTVNLADRDAERYAQLGVTLELDDTKTGDLVKAYMPAIRNKTVLHIMDGIKALFHGGPGARPARMTST